MPDVSQHVPAPKTTGWEPFLTPSPAQSVPSPSAVPAQPVRCPTCTQTLRAFPIPLLALLPSKRNRLHLELLPRRPRVAGAQPRERVCVGACSHMAARTMLPLRMGGPRVPDLRELVWEVLSTQRWSQPDLSAAWARLIGCLLGDQDI